MGDQTEHAAISDLSETEQRLYDLARQTMPLAEIAVRLGVPIGDAERRITALLGRLNLSDRAALQRGIGPVVPGGDLESEANAHDADLSAREAKGGVSRRTFIGGAIVLGGLVAASAGGILLLGRGGSDLKVPPLGSPTPGGTTPFADSLALIERNDAAWEQRSFSAGELVDWSAGVFFMQMPGGEIEGIRFAAGSEPAGGTVLANGELIMSANAGNESAGAWHRCLRRGWTWPGTRWWLAAATDKYLVFEELTPRTGSGPGTPVGGFRVLNYDLKEVSSFSEPPSNFPQNLSLSPNGNKAAVWSQSENGSSARIVRIDLTTGRVESGVDVQVPVGAIGGLADGETLPTTGIFLAPVGFYPSPSTPSDTVFESVWFRLPWDGAWENVQAQKGQPPSFWAPNASAYCEEVAMRGYVGGGGEGGGENWPAVIVRDQVGETQFVVQSAALYYGDALGQRRWLADSSGFAAMVDNGATEGDGFSRLGYAVVKADGSGLEMLPTPPAGEPAAFNTPAYRGAVPHPAEAALMAFGHLDAVDRRSNTWFHANIPADSFRGHIDPWAGRPNELTFVLPHLGHGGGGIPSLITPKLSKTLPADMGGDLQVRIKGEGECLNLRSLPSLTGNARTCLADGSVLTVVDQPVVGDDRQPPSFQRNEYGSWAFVKTTTGETGWVSASYLEWV